jgi:DNA-binding NarL/FixJ family response regulator
MSLDIEQFINLIDQMVIPGQLCDLEEQIFRLTCDGLTYSEIACKLGYDKDHIKRVGAKFWQKLSAGLREKVTKKNFRRALLRYSMANN